MTDSPHSRRPGIVPIPGLGPAETWPDGLDTAFIDDLGDIPTPTSWPAVSSDRVIEEWASLRAWVEDLCARFAHLDHHVVPRCWWRHNEHVEALVALRDHERASFSDTAPAAAPVDWFRAMRDIAALLRAWTADTGCGASHQASLAVLRQPDNDEWADFIRGDSAARQRRQTEPARNAKGTDS